MNAAERHLWAYWWKGMGRMLGKHHALLFLVTMKQHDSQTKKKKKFKNSSVPPGRKIHRYIERYIDIQKNTGYGSSTKKKWKKTKYQTQTKKPCAWWNPSCTELLGLGLVFWFGQASVFFSVWSLETLINVKQFRFPCIKVLTEIPSTLQMSVFMQFVGV